MPAGEIFELTASSIESITDRHEGILVLVRGLGIATHGELRARHPQIDTNMEQTSFERMFVCLLEDDVTTDDARVEPLELFRSLAQDARYRG